MPRKAEHPYRALFETSIERQAELVARWLLVGFIHGVMNTDNMSIAGETIDYGPCAFMDTYHPTTVFSSIDQHGRYAYANQPRIATWNLARLAEALLPLLDEDQDRAVAYAQGVLEAFGPKFEAAFNAGLGRKLGLFTQREGDVQLAADLLTVMAENGADFTLTFRRLSDAAIDPAADQPVRSLFTDPAAYDGWATRWRERLDAGGAGRRDAPRRDAGGQPGLHPAQPPGRGGHRGGRAARRLRAVRGAAYSCCRSRSRISRAFAPYADPPKPHERVEQTFCGT